MPGWVAAVWQLRRTAPVADLQVHALGIPLYLSQHALVHTTLAPRARAWPPAELWAYNGRIERALAAHSLHAAQIGPAWPLRVIPTLALAEDQLVLGVGTALVVHPLVAPRHGGAAGGSHDGRGNRYSARVAYPPHTSIPLSPRGCSGGADIVGIHILPDRTLAVAQFDGTLQRLALAPRPGGGLMPRSLAHYVPFPRPANMNLLVGAGQQLVAAVPGAVHVWKAGSPWVPPSVLELPAGKPRAWSALLAPEGATGPRLFLGLNCGVHEHAVRPSGVDAQAARVLLGPKSRSAAYALALPPPRSAHSPATLLAAWHDGTVRLYDLRARTCAPALALSDPWSDAALYSAAFVGERCVAAGGAQHGAVSVWDVRVPAAGWTVFSPSGRGSPVYALAGEGGRAWGVTERRAFVLAFDGTGDAPGGLVAPSPPPVPPPSPPHPARGRGKPRGPPRAWDLGHDAHGERRSTMGYRHGDRGMALFETRVPA